MLSAIILFVLFFLILWMIVIVPIFGGMNRRRVATDLASVGLIGGRISDFHAVDIASLGAGAAALDPVNHVLRVRSLFGFETLIDLALVHAFKPGSSNEDWRFALTDYWRVADGCPEEELFLSFSSKDLRDRFYNALGHDVNEARLTRRSHFPPKQPSLAFAAA